MKLKTKTLKILLIVVLHPAFLFCQSTPTFVTASHPFQTIPTGGSVENTGAVTVDFNSDELHGICWDGAIPSFAIIHNANVLTQSLDGINLGLVIDPDIVIDPRSNNPRNILISYTVDYDNIPNNNSPTDIRYEVWSYNGSILTLVHPSSIVPSNTFSNEQSNADVSLDGEVAIVYHNGFNTVINAIPDLQNPALISQFCLVELPCVSLCQSERPDVTLVKDPTSNVTKASVSFVWSEALNSPPYYVSVHTFNYSLVANNQALNCAIYSGVLYESSDPEHYVGWPRIDGPDRAISGQTHLNDYQLAVDVIEDWDISDHTFIMTYNKHNNGGLIDDVASENNPWPNSGTYPPYWTNVNTYPNNNPFAIGGTYGGSTYLFSLITTSNFRPAVAYSNGMHAICWEHSCKNLNNSQYNECDYPTTAFVGSPDKHIVARQFEAGGSPQNPFISIVYNATDPTQIDGVTLPSVSGKYNPSNNILYVGYNELTFNIQWKSVPNFATSLKRNYSNNMSEYTQPKTIEIKSDPTKQNVVRISQSGYINDRITITVLDLSGKPLLKKDLIINSDIVSLNLGLDNLSSGMYLLILNSLNGQQIAFSKIIIAN